MVYDGKIYLCDILGCKYDYIYVGNYRVYYNFFLEYC